MPILIAGDPAAGAARSLAIGLFDCNGGLSSAALADAPWQPGRETDVQAVCAYRATALLACERKYPKEAGANALYSLWPTRSSWLISAL